MAGKAKLRLLGAFDMCGSGHGATKHRKNTEGHEGQHLPRHRDSYSRTDDDNRDKNRRDHQQGVQQGFRRWQIQCNVPAHSQHREAVRMSQTF